MKSLFRSYVTAWPPGANSWEGLESGPPLLETQKASKFRQLEHLTLMVLCLASLPAWSETPSQSRFEALDPLTTCSPSAGVSSNKRTTPPVGGTGFDSEAAIAFDNHCLEYALNRIGLAEHTSAQSEDIRKWRLFMKGAIAYFMWRELAQPLASDLTPAISKRTLAETAIIELLGIAPNFKTSEFKTSLGQERIDLLRKFIKDVRKKMPLPSGGSPPPPVPKTGGEGSNNGLVGSIGGDGDNGTVTEIGAGSYPGPAGETQTRHPPPPPSCPPGQSRAPSEGDSGPCSPVPGNGHGTETPLSIETFNYVDSSGFRGRGPSNALISIYIDQAYVGHAFSNSNGYWIYKVKAQLSKGEHTVAASVETNGIRRMANAKFRIKAATQGPTPPHVPRYWMLIFEVRVETEVLSSRIDSSSDAKNAPGATVALELLTNLGGSGARLGLALAGHLRRMEDEDTSASELSRSETTLRLDLRAHPVKLPLSAAWSAHPFLLAGGFMPLTQEFAPGLRAGVGVSLESDNGFRLLGDLAINKSMQLKHHAWSASAGAGWRF